MVPLPFSRAFGVRERCSAFSSDWGTDWDDERETSGWFMNAQKNAPKNRREKTKVKPKTMDRWNAKENLPTFLYHQTWTPRATSTFSETSVGSYRLVDIPGSEGNLFDPGSGVSR